MKTINHECYVSLEVAKLLEQAGFDWRCFAHYHNGILDSFCNIKDNYNSKHYEDGGYNVFYSAPTIDVTQRWLREVKNIFIEVTRYETIHPLARKLFKAVYDKTVDQSFAYGVNVLDANNESIYDEDCFLIYEGAQEAGIKKALELILENGE